ASPQGRHEGDGGGQGQESRNGSERVSAAPASGSVLALHDIGKCYRMGEQEFWALREVTLDIAANEYLAFIGPSGSGKSTLMNVLGCLDQPTRGEYVLNGTPVSALDDNALAD